MSLATVGIAGTPVAEAPITRVDTGLGTTFERWAVNRLLSRLLSELDVQTLFEGPDDGMCGIAGLNSLVAGLQGVRRVAAAALAGTGGPYAKTVWEHHAPDARLEIAEEWDGRRLPFDDGAFDLAWNFNIMTRPEDPQALLAEMARVSRKYVLIFVPNRMNYAFWLHRLHHWVACAAVGSRPHRPDARRPLAAACSPRLGSAGTSRPFMSIAPGGRTSWTPAS